MIGNRTDWPDKYQLPANMPSPEWLTQCDATLDELLALPPNWNSYEAAAVRPSAIRTAKHLLAKVIRSNTPQPAIVPTIPGGVQLEWHTHGIDLEIEIVPPCRVHVFYENASERREWELQSEGDFARLLEATTHLT